MILNRPLFKQNGGPIGAMPPQMGPPQMGPPPQMGLPPGVEAELANTEGAAQAQGEKLGLDYLQSSMSALDGAESYRDVINAFRGNDAPLEARYNELAGFVGPDDAMRTPESVLTLVQPTIMMTEQGAIDSGIGQLMEQVAGGVDMGADPQMEQGLGQLMAANQAPQMPPVQNFDEGGGVSVRQYYDEYLPLYREVMGSASEDAARRQRSLDIAQAGFAFASGVDPSTGKSMADQPLVAQLSRTLQPFTQRQSERLAAQRQQEQATQMGALQAATATRSADEAARRAALTALQGAERQTERDRLSRESREEVARAGRESREEIARQGLESRQDVAELDRRSREDVAEAKNRAARQLATGTMVSFTDENNLTQFAVITPGTETSGTELVDIITGEVVPNVPPNLITVKDPEAARAAVLEVRSKAPENADNIIEGVATSTDGGVQTAFEAIQAGTGFWANVKEAMDNGLSPFTDAAGTGHLFSAPNHAQARSYLLLLQNLMREAFVISGGRPGVWEQQRAAQLAPDPDEVFTTPDKVAKELVQVRQELQKQVAQQDAASEDALNRGEYDRATQLSQGAAAKRRILRMIGPLPSEVAANVGQGPTDQERRNRAINAAINITPAGP